MRNVAFFVISASRKVRKHILFCVLLSLLSKMSKKLFRNLACLNFPEKSLCLQDQIAPVIVVCTSMGTLQTGTANS